MEDEKWIERQEAVKSLRDELFAFASPYRPRIIIISYGRQAPLKRSGTANQPRRFICSETSSSLLPANPNFQSGEFCGLRFIGSRFVSGICTGCCTVSLQLCRLHSRRRVLHYNNSIV